MTDNWDDSDDEWDADDDELDARLGLKKVADNLPSFDDDEDLALKEKAEEQAKNQADLKKKGTAYAAKKAAEKERQEELEIARKAVALEADAESNMTDAERKALGQRRVEEADNELTNDLFGGVDSNRSGPGAAAAAGDTLVLKDVKDHLKHARRVAEAFQEHGKIHLVSAFFKELLEHSKSVLDDAAVSDIIRECNLIKNEKVQSAKRKVKGQAQKAKKVDKAAEAKARQVQVDTFGDNDQYDNYDQMGADYEDAFF